MKSATGVADGLAYRHYRGIKHLDMKPGNVLMVHEGKEGKGWSVRIADFGMEDDKEDDGDRQSKDDGEVYGTWECVTIAAASRLSACSRRVSHAGTWRRSASAASTAAPHSPPTSSALESSCGRCSSRSVCIPVS